MRKLNNQKGSTMAETLMVLTLLVLFGMTIYTLIYSGAGTQDRIMQEKDAQSDARIALSYINVRLKQNDSLGKIGIERLELTGENAIIIRERTFEYEYDTWIYCYNGKLYECLVDPDEQPTEMSSFFIVNADRLETQMEENAVTNTVYYTYNDSLASISSTIGLRSHY